MKCKMYLRNFGEFFENQVKSAGTIILSRTDKADTAKVEAAVKMLRELNPEAHIITTPVEVLGGKKVLDTMEGAIINLEQVEEEEHHHHHHDHDADEVFTSWGVETAKKFSKADIEHALTELDTGNYGMILRSKGIVDGGADGWLEFDYVPGEWEVRARGADVGGKLVVIGSKLNEKAIAELFGC